MSMCPIAVLTSQFFDLQTYILVHRYIFVISRWRSSIKVMRSRSWGQGQGHASITKCMLVSGLRLTERQSLVLLMTMKAMIIIYVIIIVSCVEKVKFLTAF